MGRHFRRNLAGCAFNETHLPYLMTNLDARLKTLCGFLRELFCGEVDEPVHAYAGISLTTTSKAPCHLSNVLAA
jgi:hypothetical protein